MKALTLWQPWASLMAIGVKTIETRSWSAPEALIGQRIAIHAAVRPVPDGAQIGDWRVVRDADDVRWQYLVEWPVGAQLDTSRVWYPMPFGAVVATGLLIDCVQVLKVRPDGTWTIRRPSSGPATRYGRRGIPLTRGGIRDQLPYGLFTPGRWAWLFVEVYPELEPVPAVGHQRLWDWER